MLAGFEPGILCSVGGHDDHNATPPGQKSNFYCWRPAISAGLFEHYLGCNQFVLILVMNYIS
jgi:hypothetical protein